MWGNIGYESQTVRHLGTAKIRKDVRCTYGCFHVYLELTDFKIRYSSAWKVSYSSSKWFEKLGRNSALKSHGRYGDRQKLQRLIWTSDGNTFPTLLPCQEPKSASFRPRQENPNLRGFSSEATSWRQGAAVKAETDLAATRLPFPSLVGDPAQHGQGHIGEDIA